MNLLSYAVLFISVLLFIQSTFSLYLMLYSWESAEKLLSIAAPSSFLAPRYSFSALLPARHEEAVIYQTIQRVWSANYPSQLLEIVVICHADDAGTIAEARRAIRAIGSPLVRVEIFSAAPINKPHALNIGLKRTFNQIVTIFDAEDDIDLNIFKMINTVMIKEGVGVVQSGVQLMNFNDHWFAFECLG